MYKLSSECSIRVYSPFCMSLTTKLFRPNAAEVLQHTNVQTINYY